MGILRKVHHHHCYGPWYSIGIYRCFPSWDQTSQPAKPSATARRTGRPEVYSLLIRRLIMSNQVEMALQYQMGTLVGCRDVHNLGAIRVHLLAVSREARHGTEKCKLPYCTYCWESCTGCYCTHRCLPSNGKHEREDIWI